MDFVVVCIVNVLRRHRDVPLSKKQVVGRVFIAFVVGEISGHYIDFFPGLLGFVYILKGVIARGDSDFLQKFKIRPVLPFSVSHAHVAYLGA